MDTKSKLIILALSILLLLSLGWGLNNKRQLDEAKRMDMNMSMSDHNTDNLMDPNHDMNMTMNDMNKALLGKDGAELEYEFLKQMIPHHQGAIDMAKRVLSNPNVSTEIKNFANQIIQAQSAEIEMMQNWLNKYHNPKG